MAFKAIDTEKTLTTVSKLDGALASATTPEDIKDLRDKAGTYVVWLKKIHAHTTEINIPAELKLRAERKLGEWLAAHVSAGNPQFFRDERIGKLPQDISFTQSHRWQLIALIPLEVFEQDIADLKSKEEVITTEYFILLGRKYARLLRREDLIANPPPLPEGVFGLLYADPPWRYEFSQSETRHIENQYPTMSLEEICNFEVRGVSLLECLDDNALLYLWATNPKLKEAFAVIEAWGFEYVTNMVWVKDKIGMGYYCRQQHEMLLIAKRGTPPLVLTRPEDRPCSVLSGPRGQHSAKPEHVYTLLNTLYPGLPKLEIFNRGAPDGLDCTDWTFWGVEA